MPSNINFLPLHHIYTADISSSAKLESYSWGSGHFHRGIPSAEIYDVSFRVSKNPGGTSLNIQIHDVDLILWLCQHVELEFSEGEQIEAHTTLDDLLPCYPSLRSSIVHEGTKRFMDTGMTRDPEFMAMELFARHFLLDSSFFEMFGFEALHESHGLTLLHFQDIQHRSIREDLDRLDESIDSAFTTSDQTPIQLNSTTRSELQRAIRQRDLEVVKAVLLLDSGAIDGQSLCDAIRFYDPAIFHRLIAHGCIVEERGTTFEPLYLAAKTGNMDAVQTLLQNHAKIDGGSFSKSNQPLTGAASNGHFQIVQYLVEHNANVNGNGHSSPLSRAIKRKHLHVAEYLIATGALLTTFSCWELLINAVVDDESHVIQFFLSHGVGLDFDDHLPNIIPEAAEKGKFEFLKTLFSLDTHVDENVCKSVLFRACFNGHLEIVDYLVTKGVSIDMEQKTTVTLNSYEREYFDHSIMVAERNPQSLLAAALHGGHVKVVRYLIDHGATLTEDEQKLRHDYGSYFCGRRLGSLLDLEINALKQVSCPANILTGEPFDTSCSFTIGWVTALPRGTRKSVFDYGTLLETEWEHAADYDVSHCPMIAAIQDQDRRKMGRQLLTKYQSRAIR